MSNQAIVTEFFAQWNDSYDSLRGSLLNHFSEDCLWDQRPFAVTTGPGPAVEFMDRCRRFGGIETIEVELVHIAEAGDTVLCERIDHLHRRSGSLIASVPVAGILDLQDGKIVNWREYSDALGVVRQAASSGLRASFAWLRGGTR